ncbi:hypothetical protein CIB48_g3570 [Xylaria polymorpha]|nr:hypothetical protein CIB48_g3570 [Xylaria polymorpha]
MRLINLLTLTTFSAIAVAWTDQVALEFATPGCHGLFSHAWIGSDRRQIKSKYLKSDAHPHLRLNATTALANTSGSK